jgi:DNA modification methylase
VWQKYASPVWMDINPNDTLQYKSAREEQDERHICPLQLQVIQRGIELWSNPGDTVLTPFMGIGSEAYMAVKMGRRAVGVELKDSYYRQAVRNVKNALENMQTDLFDMITGEEIR